MNKTQETQVNCIKTTCLTTLTVLVGAAALWTLGGISPASAASNRAPLSAEPPTAILQEPFPHSPSDRIAVPVSEAPATLKVDVDGQDDEPDILFSSHDGYLLFQSGPPNGVAGLSNVNGIVDGEWLDRALIDDFVLDGNAIVTAVGINGVWFNGTGGDTPLEGLRVRLWSATPDGLPGELLFDDFVPHEAVETGDVYFGRPEIVYIAHLPDFELPGGGSIISIQPVGTLDGFFQLTAASGLDEIFGIEVHVSYPDMDLPPWTPGHVAFDEYHDVVFTVWGEWVTDGTETCEDWCGTQSPFGCWCDELCDDFDDCCEDVCEACEDELDFCDPGIDPYICEGYCGGPSPGGCWCDEWCKAFDDCCEDVCDSCEDELDFCDDLFDPYVCEGYCGGMAPGGCWCDDWCDLFDDCCDDVCDECEEDVSFCDPNIDPYDCHGELNGDGVVDGGDLLILLSNWGNCADPDDCPADLNNNGVVDGGDLLILLSNWGDCPVQLANFPELAVSVVELSDDSIEIFAMMNGVNPGEDAALYMGFAVFESDDPFEPCPPFPDVPCAETPFCLLDPELVATATGDADRIATFGPVTIPWDGTAGIEDLLFKGMTQQIDNCRRSTITLDRHHGAQRGDYCAWKFNCALDSAHPTKKCPAQVIELIMNDPNQRMFITYNSFSCNKDHECPTGTKFNARVEVGWAQGGAFRWPCVFDVEIESVRECGKSKDSPYRTGGGAPDGSQCQ